MARIPNPCLGASLEALTYETEWFGIREPFTPSNVQLTRYAKFFAHQCVMNFRKSPPTITFDDDALRILRKRYPRDPVYALIEEYRELEKCLGTYVSGMTPGVDGRYREEFTHTPKTLRLAMKLLQLLPRGTDGGVYAKIRGLIVASAGKVLYARDFSGIEAVVVAYLANDPAMYRLAGEVQGMHDFVASHAIGKGADLSLSDEDLRAYFQELKQENRIWEVAGGSRMRYKDIRQGCKRAGFLSFYGGTAPRMVQAEPLLFPDRQTAQWYQDLLFAIFPSIRIWQWKTCEEAERVGYVTAPSGFRLWYPDGVFEYVFNKPNGKWEKKLGTIAKECLAAKPQHLGMVFSAKALVRAAEDPLLLEGLRLSIHDEILGEWREELLPEVDTRLKAVMEVEMEEMPLPEQWGMGRAVRVRTEAKQGMTWAEMR